MNPLPTGHFQGDPPPEYIHVCTAADPWNIDKSKRAQHPDAKDDGECSEGCCDYYKCPHCGLRFRVELPQ
jgi:hypothetical protein